MDIQHNPDKQCFTIELDHTAAVLEYRLLPKNAEGKAGVDFMRTYVPPEFRGKGYAEALVKQGLMWAKQQEFKAQASCWYVKGFL